MSNQTSNEKSEKSDQIATVSIAINECRPDETAVKNIVQPLAEQPLTGNAARHDVTANVTFGIGKRHNVTVKVCQHCGGDFETKRPTQARYCGPNCRRAAWLLRNPDKAAALAESDRERLRAHLESRGIVWQERYTNER